MKWGKYCQRKVFFFLRILATKLEESFAICKERLLDSYFERNLRTVGILEKDQLNQIRSSKIAVAGLGLGGSTFINLIRFGVEKFNIADPDIFERTNINRQRGAKERTIRSRKDETLLDEAKSINPDVSVCLFKEGVKKSNVERFITGANFIVDAIDIFALEDKLELHAKARALNIPVLVCGSIGFGATVAIFDSTTPTFNDVSKICSENSERKNVELFVNFIAPRIPHYMEDQVRKAILEDSHIPFVVSGVELAAALSVCEIAKYLLKLGRNVLAPTGIYIDPINLKIEKFDMNSTSRAFIKCA